MTVGPPAAVPAAAVERARRLFVATFGRDPAGVWAAPGRVNVIGEHTDYNEGFVLPFALDRHTLAAVAPRPDRRARCVSADLGAAPEVTLATISPRRRPAGWSAYPLGVAWALADVGVDVGGFDLLVTSDLPAGAGVSSSAALGAAVALALCDLNRSHLDRSALALAACRAENDIAGAPTGVMDPMASLQGRQGHALFLDCRSLEYRHVPWDPAASGLRLLVLDTRTRHALVAGGYADRREECRVAARTMGVRSLREADEDLVESARSRLGEERYRRARHVVTENARVLAAVALLDGGGDVAAVGPLLSASHASLRDDYQVSCAELDCACATAEAAGAIGARMTGGGFGGSAIALVPAAAVAAVSRAVTAEAGARGFPRPTVFEARTGAGARRAG